MLSSGVLSYTHTHTYIYKTMHVTDFILATVKTNLGGIYKLNFMCVLNISASFLLLLPSRYFKLVFPSDVYVQLYKMLWGQIHIIRFKKESNSLTAGA